MMLKPGRELLLQGKKLQIRMRLHRERDIPRT
jgi:hypothetical protein